MAIRCLHFATSCIYSRLIKDFFWSKLQACSTLKLLKRSKTAKNAYFLCESNHVYNSKNVPWMGTVFKYLHALKQSCSWGGGDMGPITVFMSSHCIRWGSHWWQGSQSHLLSVPLIGVFLTCVTFAPKTLPSKNNLIQNIAGRVPLALCCFL